MDSHTSTRREKRRRFSVSRTIEEGDINYADLNATPTMEPETRQNYQPIEISSQGEDSSDDDVEITGTSRVPTPLTYTPISNLFPSFGAVSGLDVDDDVRIVDERPLLNWNRGNIHNFATAPIGIYNFSSRSSQNRNRHSRNNQHYSRNDPFQLYDDPNFSPNPHDPQTPVRIRGMSSNRRLRRSPVQTRNTTVRPRGSRPGIEQRFRGWVAAIPSFAQFGRFFDNTNGGSGAESFFASLHQNGLDHFLQLDQIETSIMQRIERENEGVCDLRFQNELLFNRKILVDKKACIREKELDHTNDINPEANLGCELCGVILGEGIPADFKVDPRYNDDYALYSQYFRVQAPWICSAQITDIDKDILRRVFFNKCGHALCGRCVKAIGNRPRRKRGSGTNTISNTNPLLYAPSKCPAKGCLKQFTTKSLTEIFF